MIGAIEDIHLEMKLSEEQKFEPSFINYKQFHSVHLQVCLVKFISNKLFESLNSYSPFTLTYSYMATEKNIIVKCL